MGCGPSNATGTAVTTQPNTQSSANSERIKPVEGDTTVKRQTEPSANGKHVIKEQTLSNGKHDNLTVNDRNVVTNENNAERDDANTTDITTVDPTVPEAPGPSIKENKSDSLAHSEGVTRVEDRRGSATITEDISISEDLKALVVAGGDQQDEQQLPETFVASVRTSPTKADEQVTSGLDATPNENELEYSRTLPSADGSKNVNSPHQLRRSLEEDSVPPVSGDNTSHQTENSLKCDPVPAATGDANLVCQEEESLKDSALSVIEETALSVKEDSTVPSATVAESTYQDKNSNPLPHTVEQPTESDGDATMDDQSTRERICSLAASVAVPSEYGPLNGNNVMLSGSVFRVPNANPDLVVPGKRIGHITGQITATPIGSETGQKIATIRGSLFSANENASSGGQIAHASVDVVSCSTSERVAIITADVYPDSECPDESSAVITGDVIALAQNGSTDEPIGTVEGHVVALVFKEGVFEFSSEEE